MSYFIANEEFQTNKPNFKQHFYPFYLTCLIWHILSQFSYVSIHYCWVHWFGHGPYISTDFIHFYHLYHSILISDHANAERDWSGSCFMLTLMTKPTICPPLSHLVNLFQICSFLDTSNVAHFGQVRNIKRCRHLFFKCKSRHINKNCAAKSDFWPWPGF